MLTRKTPPRGGLVSLALAALVWLGPSVAGAAERPPLPAEDWPRASAESQGLDPAKLERLIREIEEGERFPDLHSLLVVRHGYLVVEEYFGGWSSDLGMDEEGPGSPPLSRIAAQFNHAGELVVSHYAPDGLHGVMLEDITEGRREMMREWLDGGPFVD